MLRTLVATLILVLPCLPGCGGGADRPALLPVSGTVLFKGQPVEGATVSFSNEKASRSAQGVTDANGKFKLTSYDTNDGAIAGEHVVTISKAAAVSDDSQMTQANAMEMMKKKMDGMKGKNMSDQKPEMLLPAKYADGKTSGEKRTVKSGDSNDFKFELTE
jgi:hypothetical protein